MGQYSSVPKYKLATIYSGLHRLSRRVKKLYFYMSKTDRIVYYDDIKLAAHECIRDFCIAYDFQDERPHWYMKLVGDFHTLTSLIDEVRDEDVLRTPKEKVVDVKTGTHTEIPMNTDKILLAIYEEIGKIDESISRWRAVALNGKNTHE